MALPVSAGAAGSDFAGMTVTQLTDISTPSRIQPAR
jgi:hypothetical protein